jgi:hypothetical protein
MAQKYRDLASRAAWAGLWTVLSFLTVESLDVPVGWAPFIAVALSSAKSFVATKVGDPDEVTFR